MRKFTQQTAARLVVTLVVLVGLAAVASEYLSRNPPPPNTFLGKAWQIVAR